MAGKGSSADKDVAMQVRVLPATYARFKRAAERDNRTLSSWVRDRLEKAARADLKK